MSVRGHNSFALTSTGKNQKRFLLTWRKVGEGEGQTSLTRMLTHLGLMGLKNLFSEIAKSC